MVEWARNHVTMYPLLLDADKAQWWVENQKTNRRHYKSTSRRYAQFVLEGRWRINGEPIITTAEDELLDGQNRCHGVVEANRIRPGITMPVLVIKGISRDAFETLNQGKNRSGSDTLYLKEQKNPSVLSAALGWLARYYREDMAGRLYKPCNMELVELLASCPKVTESVAFTTDKRRYEKGVTPSAAFAFLHFLCTEKHPEREEFFEQVLTGADCARGTPAFLLRKVLEERSRAKPGQGTKLDMVHVLALSIQAWNATVRGQRLRKLEWSASEEFPEIL